MKVHGKLLSHYLSCCSPVDKEGYLYKKSERTGSYQKRWFVLKGNLLFYQERRSDGSLLGVIVLEGCSIELCESDEHFAFSVGFSGHGCGTYTFAAEDQPCQESWIKALLSASHGFLSMLVGDLERRYHEVVSETCDSAPCQQAGLDGKGFTQFLASQNYGPSVPRRGQSCHISQLLQVPPTSRRNTSKISPKLWTKRTIHERAVNEPAVEVCEGSSGGLPPLEDFCTLHELYGKEVKDLIAVRQIMGRKDEEDVEDGEAAGSG